MSANTISVDDPPELSRPTRLHIRYLDGVRGAAALFVMAYHCQLVIGSRHGGSWCPPGLRPFVGWMAYGHYAVAVFIVLSGYCLALPIVRKPPDSLITWWADFTERRARRILPPYYAALALGVGQCFIGKVTGLSKTQGADLTAPSLLSHLFLVHNLTPWSRALDAPLWSVATEWQIYFLFALILLPLFLRYGITWALCAALVIGFAPHLLLPRDHNFDGASPWFVGGFGIGMAGAWVNFSEDAYAVSLRKRTPWLLIAGALFAVAMLACVFIPVAAETQSRDIPGMAGWAGDTFIELLSFVLLAGLTRSASAPQGRQPLLLKVLDHPWLVGIGTFSYSIYLIHQLLLQSAATLAWHLGLNAVHSFALVLASVPFVLGVCYLFSLAFERPFLISRRCP